MIDDGPLALLVPLLECDAADQDEGVGAAALAELVLDRQPPLGVAHALVELARQPRCTGRQLAQAAVLGSLGERLLGETERLVARSGVEVVLHALRREREEVVDAVGALGVAGEFGVVVGAQRLERVVGRVVEAPAFAAEERLEDRVADQFVTERELVGVVFDQEATTDDAAQPIDQLHLVETERRLQEVELETRAEYRSHGEQLSFVGGEVIGGEAHRLGERPREGPLLDVRRVGGGVADQLLEEEGATATAGVQLREHAMRPDVADRLLHVLGDLVGAEGFEVDVHRRAPALDDSQELDGGMADGEVLGSVRDDQRGVRRRRHHPLEHLERLDVGPVQVLEHDQLRIEVTQQRDPGADLIAGDLSLGRFGSSEAGRDAAQQRPERAAER